MIFGNDPSLERLKWAFESCKNGAWGDEPDGENDTICIRAADFEDDFGVLSDGQRTLRAIDESTYRKISLRAGDLIVEKSGGGEKQLVGRAVIYAGLERAVCSNFLARCRPSELVTSEYLNYLMLGIYKARGTYPHIKQTTGIQNLDLASFLNTRVRLPPLETQSRRAAFLDQKTAQIDGLIEKKRALLDRLAEKRQAIITQAVTKGLNPAAPMKDSGIDWLGQIPAHWEVKRLSFVSQVIDCKHRTPEYIDDGVPLVSTSEISPYRIDYETKRQVSEEELALMSEGGRQPRMNDIIYSRNASVGSAALARDDRTVCLGQDLCLVRSLSVMPDFLEHFLNSEACLEQLGSFLVGATFKRVNVDVIKKYTLPLPPKAEQEAITEFVGSKASRADAIQRMVSDSIASLDEYRSALITAAVTGRIAELR